VEFFGLLGGVKKDPGWDGAGMSNARLAILPGTTHYTIFASPKMVMAAVEFLAADTRGEVGGLRAKEDRP